jgi:hypoxanthine phosphoribosyltransferase
MRPKRPLDHAHEGLHEIGWEEFGALCRKLALEVDRRGGCDAVVGIVKGGAIVGGVISALLRRDYYDIRLSRHHGGERAQMTTRVPVAPPRDLSGRRVLLCDDMSFSGETFKIARLELSRVGVAAVTTCALARHEGSWRADVCALVTNAALVLPWDREVLVDGEFRLHPEIARGLAAQGIERG